MPFSKSKRKLVLYNNLCNANTVNWRFPNVQACPPPPQYQPPCCPPPCPPPCCNPCGTNVYGPNGYNPDDMFVPDNIKKSRCGRCGPNGPYVMCGGFGGGCGPYGAGNCVQNSSCNSRNCSNYYSGCGSGCAPGCGSGCAPGCGNPLVDCLIQTYLNSKYSRCG